MADVKVPALLHKMSKAAQKAWYKKNNMKMPSETDDGGKSAAAAKKVKVEPRKKVAAKPETIRALNAARQKGYYEKGGRSPVGAAGPGGQGAMVGVDQGSAKQIIKGIKAGVNPKVALVRYTNEEVVEEATKKEAEALLGGPVKAKPKMPPGKQPAGYRYVRGLARKAMKAGMKNEEVEQVDEKAPPGAKFERMVKHIKKGYAKDGLTKQEKSIAYATAWKAYGKKEEVEQTDEAVRIVDIEKKGKLPKKQDVRNRLALAARERRKITGGSGVKGFNKPIGFSPTKYMDTSYVRAMKKEEVEQVTEAEGTVAVTPKEKALAAHHGDPKKITYGDVIKARLKSVAAKAMNKGK